MDPSNPLLQQLAQQLEDLAAALREEALPPARLPRALAEILHTLNEERPPSTLEMIDQEREGGVDALEEELDALAQGLLPGEEALELSQPELTPPLETEEADTSEHSMLELLGLDDEPISEGSSRIALASPPSLTPAPTSSERILEERVEDPLAPPPSASGGFSATVRARTVRSGSFQGVVRPGPPTKSGHTENPRRGDRWMRLQEPLSMLPASRYEVRGTLGMGGQGDVREVYDRILQRTVALKALKEELVRQNEVRRAFLREARLLAQLSHPSIVPVYDLGELASGAPAYTMRRISGRSLRDIFHAMRRGELSSRDYSRRRLLEILQQVALTVGYAHHRGVVHRDLKPGNIMVGDFGEVMVVDWGIARVHGDHPAFQDDDFLPSGAPPIRTHSGHEPTVQGTIKGTPSYMAPEQARGDNAFIGPWTDVHALGLILYELLLGEPARETGLAEEVVLAAQQPVRRTPEQRRLEDRVSAEPIPEELDVVCMKCLAEPFSERYPDGETVARALRAFLDGQRRREQAEQRAVEAELTVKKLTALQEESMALRGEYTDLRARIKPWHTAQDKRPLWELEKRLQTLETQREELQNQAVLSFVQALDDDPENARARQGLCELYYQRLLVAEQFGRLRDARQLEAQIRRLDDGQLSERLEGLGTLSLDILPERADIWLYRYEQRDHLLQPVEPQRLGKSPLVINDLPMGRYLVVVRMRGGRELYYPVWLRRNAHWKGTLHLRPELDERFVHVPAGPFMMGGDRLAPNALPREERYVGDFAVARQPVTCKEYLHFLDSLPLEKALQHAPRTSALQGSKVWWTVEERQIKIPPIDEAGGRWNPRYPIRAISRRDAEAYIAWRAQEEGLRLRLPTEAEWEKAARGVDGRYFPWGDTFDASFCKMRDSRPGRPDPEPVGAFPLDRSPYGVQDMAGSISEWVSDPYDRFQLLGNLKGGFWRGGEASCRLATRFASDPDEPAPFAGFRLVLDLDIKR